MLLLLLPALSEGDERIGFYFITDSALLVKYLPEISVISEIKKKRVFHQSYPKHRNNPRFLFDSVLKIASPEFPKSTINWKHQEVSRQNSAVWSSFLPQGR